MRNGVIKSNKINTFINMDKKAKGNFIKAYWYTGIVRALILFIPFNKLTKYIGEKGVESPDVVENQVYKLAKDIGHAVIHASKYTPWKSLCLVQALTVQRMLKEKKISSTVYLGVKKGGDNNMLAHAWVRCGSYVITGDENKHEYVVVAKFSSKL